MKQNLLTISLIALTASVVLAQHTEKVDTATFSKIKKEEMSNSKVMEILSMLTDVHGPRLTNSPGHKRAAEYARSTLASWGLQNASIDQWDEEFGRGWQLKKFNLQMQEPTTLQVISHPKAWSPGIKGTVTTEVVYLDAKTEADLEKYKGKLKGKIVLLSAPVAVKPGFKPDATRLNDSLLLKMANATLDNSGNDGFFFRRPSGAMLQAMKLSYAKWQLCEKEGVVAVLEASPGSRLEDGTIMVSAATIPYPPDVPFDKRVRAQSANAPKILPQVVVSDEHYNRMVRLVQKGIPVKMEMTLETEFTPAANGFNVIAEIPGTDLKDEVVMIGAHLDSWHSGTGATDNAAGSAVMMEAMRLLKSLGVSPRRTIRIGLWGGEEQGLIGSRNYVKRTFGQRHDRMRPYDSIELKPAAAKFSVYLNMDNGTGKYRGIYLQENEAAGPVFRMWFKPFNKMGAATITLDNTGGTDHQSFDAIGLPGFQFIQDPIEYGNRTHHTSMDVYDKAIEDDLKHNAMITASFAWQAANRDGLFPRK
ncbi:MAG: M20/M25/M40 family metallo-hydrolase [Bacteroidetes bacterium]|nr:M20/M25/M40 family metallo-hydrolase [Bacteroidota bacterium]MBS1540823.1 M20/M25/M40 family metallo-hydrolase [Bacteroidota bacterium]